MANNMNRPLTSLLLKRKVLLPDELEIVLGFITQYGHKIDQVQFDRFLDSTRHLGRQGAHIRNALRAHASPEIK